MFESFPHINDLKGNLNPKDAEDRLKSYEATNLEKIREIEQDPLPEEEEIIQLIIYGLRIMLKNVYHIEPKPVSRERIHVVHPGSLRENYGGGVINSLTGQICVESIEGVFGSKVAFAKALAHELVHYLSYISLRPDPDQNDKAELHRHGLSVVRFTDNEVQDLFHKIDEAMTMYIAHDFCRMEFDRSQETPYAVELQAVKEIKDWLHSLPETTPIDRYKWDKLYILSIPYAEEMSAILNSDVNEEEKLEFYKNKIDCVPDDQVGYLWMERIDEFNKLMEEIESISPSEQDDQFISGLFKDLIRLKFTGEGYVAIARLIERRLGRGSFIKLAERFRK